MENLEILISKNKVESDIEKYSYKNDAYINSSFFSKLTFLWSYRIVKLSSYTQINNQHLGKLEGDNKVEDFCVRFSELWFDKNYQKIKTYPLLKTLLVSNSSLFIEIMCLLFVAFIFELADIYLLKYYIKIYENPERNFSYQLKIAITFIGIKIISAFLQKRAKFLQTFLSDRPLIQLNHLIITKVLKESPSNTKNKYTQGQLVNLIASDADKVKFVFEYLPSTLFMAIKILIYIIILFQFMGFPFIFSLITVILIVWINFSLQSYRGRVEVETNKVKDRRMKVSTELMNHIKFAKLFSWENEFLKRIFSERNKEIALLSTRFLITSVSSALFSVCSQMVSLVAIATYYYYDGYIILSDIFLLINIFTYLQDPLVMIPILSVYMNDLIVGLSRIEKFINQDEIDETRVITDKSDFSIKIQNGNFSWGMNIDDQKQTKDEKNPLIISQEYKLTLKNINLKLKKGQLMMIIGEVGSGKSSLMQAILNNLMMIDKDTKSPPILLNGSVSYVSQNAWIRNNTLRENIIFFNDFNQSKYEKVIQKCELIHDIKVLPGGDLTEIGDKGINLSGGQKARINIARAIYADSDIYLFDDPISALDAHVGEKIMRNCILEHLIGKSRILITHAIQYLNYADVILVMKNGEIIWEGKFNELSKQEFYQDYVKNLQSKEKSEHHENTEEFIHDASRKSIKRITTNEEEEVITNSKSYYQYFSYFGLNWLILAAIAFILVQLSRTGSDVWLTIWSKLQNLENYPFFLIFIVINIVFFSFIFIRLIFISYGCLNASKGIHQDMLNGLVHAPINTFHDIIPKGRILNRLSKDLRQLDLLLLWDFSLLPLYLLRLTSAIIICAYLVYYSLLFVPFFFYGVLLITKFYIKASNDLTLIERINLSPIINNFSEIVSGAITIRAFKYEGKFIKFYLSKLQELYKVNIFKNGVSQWYSLVVQLINIFFFGVLIVSTLFFSGSLGLAAQGIALILNSSVQLQLTITDFLDRITRIENNFISVSRCLKLTEIRSELPSVLKSDETLSHWPNHGKVEFIDYSVKYRPELPLVLKNLSFLINPGEKIGVVGRTGSGKSTICLSLFRILEKDSGSILIDDVDISSVGLKKLRSNITIIPQDPMMFEGSLRYNIDPLNEFKDEDIIEALREVNLSSFVDNEKGLEMIVQENGGNISVGERQLISIARAILRKSKVVVLDEATANIDFKTEEIIQMAIRKYFKGATLITIAHRIQTIIDYDRILLMSDGRLKEFDTPANLIANKKSDFYQLYSKSV